MIWRSKYFYGNEISEYGVKHGYVDYRTLAKAFDAVLNNDIYGIALEHFGDWSLESGCDYDEEEERYTDIYQYYIVDDNGAEILKKAGEIVYYNAALDMYLWGVTHYGTSWDYVLTDIKLELED